VNKKCLFSETELFGEQLNWYDVSEVVVVVVMMILLGPEYADTTIFRTVGRHLPVATA
jgi:hypothetical protein